MRRTILLLGLLAIAGCSPDALVSVKTDKETQCAVVERAPASVVFAQLAKLVPGTVTTQAELSKLIVTLANNGDLSKDDVSRFSVKFPDAGTVDRPLTESDAQTLRGIK
jgi:hypothetical protein